MEKAGEMLLGMLFHSDRGTSSSPGTRYKYPKYAESDRDLNQSVAEAA